MILTEYVKSTNFASKDSLPSGNPLKVVKGTEIDTEFSNIATAVATKADLASPAFTGIPTVPTATAGASTTQIANTSFVTSAVTAKADLASPAFTGIPTAPTAASGTNTTQIATTAFVTSALSGAGGGMRNRIINGDMRIDQRNNGSIVGIGASAAFPVDRWRGNAATTNMTAQRSTIAPPGFTNSLNITVVTGAAIAGTDVSSLAQFIEGNSIADLGWGTVNAQPITLSFWVRSSLVGTHSGSIGSNVGATRSYVFTYTINSANTWEYKTITIPGETSGTWETNTSLGFPLRFNLGTGASWSTATPNSWQNTPSFTANGSVQLSATTGATFFITGVQVEKGSAATPFEYRPHGLELSLCQRYYERSYNTLHMFSGNAAINEPYYHSSRFITAKRATPTVTISSFSGLANGFIATDTFVWAVGLDGFIARNTATANTAGFYRYDFTASAEL